MLGLIATVGIYGYFREKADQKKALVAFADVARYRFAEEAERIHKERDRQAEMRNRDIETRKRDSLRREQSQRRKIEATSVDRLINDEDYI
jgi:hypothetical protein